MKKLGRFIHKNRTKNKKEFQNSIWGKGYTYNSGPYNRINPPNPTLNQDSIKYSNLSYKLHQHKK